MSTSRLEKFIYAICSMEVSDLPAPLSRIEKLWNCLITGETPDFEPQSRNEQYLMAMLGLYELDQLPTPMSRGEKLLYKIAIGETDLSDVPGYLSRYEELLKYLIENGGIGFEYVLHTLSQSLSTLYNTAEKPVKSAILKGNTIKNYKNNLFDNVLEKGTISISTGETNDLNLNCYRTANFIPINGNFKIAKYGIDGDLHVCFYNSNKSFISAKTYVLIQTSEGNVIVTPPTNCSFIKFYNPYDNNEPTGEFGFGVMAENEIVEFEIQSVKMPVLTTTGKNLFDGKLVQGYLSSSTGDLTNSDNRSVSSSNFIKVNGNETISISQTGFNGTIGIFNYDKDKKFLGFTLNNKQIMDGTKFIKFRIYSATVENLITNQFNIQVEIGSVSTPYEPFKSNILSTSEDVTLRGIGDVKDTLNCLTGEVTERIGEVVLDGSENWATHGYGYCLSVSHLGMYHRTTSNSQVANNFVADSVPTVSIQNLSTLTIDGIAPSHRQYKEILLFVKEVGKSNLNGLKQWLSQNPITVQYELATESVKTVDLTTVDQDGQPTKFKTYNDVTHVEIDATNIIPSVDVEVATKINETLSTMGLEHHDISETQNKLSQTIDEQTENTDATMMATTEIYENL